MTDFWKNKRVLVTGAAGFIGTHVVRLLVKKSARVTACVSPSSTAIEIEKRFAGIQERVTIRRVDLLDPMQCSLVAAKQQILLNFAALDGGNAYKKANEASIFASNIRIALNLLDAAVTHHLERFLVMSSIEVYEKSSKKLVSESSDIISTDASGYAWSKIISEQAAKYYARQYPIKIALIRAGNLYGPGDTLQPDRMRFIPRCILSVLTGKEIEVWGDGSEAMPLLYVSDFGRAALDVVRDFATAKPINIAGTEQISFRVLINHIGAIVGKRPVVRYVPSKRVSPSRRIDIRLARRKIHFQPETPFSEGLVQTVRFIQKELKI